MSENKKQDNDMINININNSDSNSSSGGTGSFLDKIFDIGIKLIIPLGLLFGLIAIVIIVQVVLPLVNIVTDIDIPLLGLLGPVGSVVGGFGVLFGWIVGR